MILHLLPDTIKLRPGIALKATTAVSPGGGITLEQLILVLELHGAGICSLLHLYEAVLIYMTSSQLRTRFSTRAQFVPHKHSAIYGDVFGWRNEHQPRTENRYVATCLEMQRASPCNKESCHLKCHRHWSWEALVLMIRVNVSTGPWVMF
jgi:hypothetical protein